jgi:hypothetical protein
MTMHSLYRDDASNSESRGWLEAAGCVTCIGALSLLYAVGHQMGAHPMAFILYALLVSALATLAFVGPGPQAWAMLAHPLSWLVGLSMILLEVFSFQTVSYVSPAHGNVMLRIATPMAMLVGYLGFRRRPQGLAILGAVVIIAALSWLIASTEPSVRWPLTASGLLAGGFLALRGFAAEFHPWNRAARTVVEKLRVTGLIILVTSVMSLVMTALAAFAVSMGTLPNTPFVPTLAQMMHMPTLLLGGLAGGAIFTCMMYLNFASVVKITTENLTAMMAFSPMTAWFFQSLGLGLGWISAPAPSAPVLAAILLCIGAVLLIIWTSIRARAWSQSLK